MDPLRDPDATQAGGGDDVIGSDGEGTIDGTHYTDLGYMRYAEKLHTPLQSILRPQQESS